jgi:hypothetical protein
MMRIRTYRAAAAAAGLLAVAPAAGASAATVPPGSALPSLQAPAFTFVPPKVGPISVDIAPTIINGKIIDPGRHILMPPVEVPPISWTPPE